MPEYCTNRDCGRCDGCKLDVAEEQLSTLRTLTETQARELAEAKALLRDCEWPDVGGAEFNLIQCPSCRQIHEYTFEPEGGRTHKPGCKLAAALAAEKKT